MVLTQTLQPVHKEHNFEGFIAPESGGSHQHLIVLAQRGRDEHRLRVPRR